MKIKLSKCTIKEMSGHCQSVDTYKQIHLMKNLTEQLNPKTRNKNKNQQQNLKATSQQKVYE
jgi:hypothetical protein